MSTFVRNIEDKPKGAINDFIFIRDNALSNQFCNRVIKKFDSDERKKDGVVGSGLVGSTRVDKNVKDTKDLKISRHDDWNDEDSVFFESLSVGLEEYRKYINNKNEGICNCFPCGSLDINDTGYKLQKYEPNGAYHWHHDWSMTDAPVASRIFTFMWYLNTIDEKDDGYTEFADGTKIQPVAGRQVFFPATWTYLHRGYPPKVRKYICNGWIYARPPNS